MARLTSSKGPKNESNNKSPIIPLQFAAQKNDDWRGNPDPAETWASCVDGSNIFTNTSKLDNVTN